MLIELRVAGKLSTSFLVRPQPLPLRDRIRLLNQQRRFFLDRDELEQSCRSIIVLVAPERQRQRLRYNKAIAQSPRRWQPWNCRTLSHIYKN